MKRKGKSVAILSGLGFAIVAGLFWLEREHVRFWWMFESIGKNAQGMPEYRHRQSGIIMVSLPGGTFTMGSPISEAGRFQSELRHEVSLSPFLIAKYEVSQAEWKLVMGSEPSEFEG